MKERLSLCILKKDFNVNYKTTIKHFGYCMIANIAMVFVLLLLEKIVPLSGNSKLYSVFVVCLYGIIGSAIYFIITWKTGTINAIFGKQIFKRIPIIKKFVKKEA